MSLDVAALRADTPGCRHVVHLNNAGAALQPSPVLDAVVGYLEREAQIGGYATADERANDLDATYHAAGRLIGAPAESIAVVGSATLAWDQAFYGLRLEPGDRIITTTTEYASNYIAYLQRARRDGIVVDVAPDTPEGDIDVGALAGMIDDDVKLVSINHMPTQQGLINPAAAIGDVTRRAGVPFLLDACQTVGQLPIDVDAIGCDFLTATSRKYLRGPRGMGFLYVRPQVMDLLEPVVLDLRGAVWTDPQRYEMRQDAKRFETWEMPMAAKVGMGRAIEYALDVGVEAGWERLRALAAGLRSKLEEIRGVTVTDRGTVLGGLVTFTVDGITASEMAADLARHAVNVSTSTRSSAVLDMDRRGLDEVVRASVHYYNTEDELDELASHVARYAARGPA